MKKERDKEIGSSLAWHARKNSNSLKTYENCTVRVGQGWPNFFTCFRPFLISQFSHGRGMCRILGEKCMFSPGSSKDGTFNLGSPLETKGFTPTAIFKFATNISRMDRIVRNTGVAVGRTCAAENSVPHVEWLLTKRKALASLCTFLTKIPNIRDTKTLTWRECSTNRVFVIQIYQTATVDYIWIIFLENTKAKCKHFLFVEQEIERQWICKK